MDPLAHTLVGAALSRTRLGRSTRLAGTALIAGANLPDIDVLSYAAGSDAALGFRRGLTHGPLALLVLPALLTLLLTLCFRRGHALDWRRLYGLAFLGCATHPLLDALNTYGVRLLAPFDDRWYYGDAVFIVDPWLWLILAGAGYLGSRRPRAMLLWLGLGAVMSFAVLGAGALLSVGARVAWVAGISAVALLRHSAALRVRPDRAAAAGLILALAYIVQALLSSSAAAAIVRAELSQRGLAEPQQLMVGPRPADPFRWDVVAETDTGYRHGSFRWLPRPSLDLEASEIPKPRPSAALDAALAAPHVQGALRWMRFPFARVEPTETGFTVYLLDARYVRRPTRGFGAAVVELDRELRVRPE